LGWVVASVGLLVVGRVGVPNTPNPTPRRGDNSFFFFLKENAVFLNCQGNEGLEFGTSNYCPFYMCYLKGGLLLRSYSVGAGV